MRSILLGGALLFSCALFAQQTDWPVLKHYEENRIDRIAMPVGGLEQGIFPSAEMVSGRMWKS